MKRAGGANGMTTIQYVAGTALALLAFVMMANFVVFLYARGVVPRDGRRRDRACEGSVRELDPRRDP